MGDRRFPGQPRAIARLAWIGVVAAGLCFPQAARAQSTTLTVTGGPLAFATPTLTDYTNLYVCAGSISAALTVASGGNRNDVLLIRLAQSTPIASNKVGVTKPIADFQYSTASNATCSTGTWASVPISTATGATVHASARVPYTQVIYFRLRIAWTTDQGGVTYTLPTVNVYVNNP